MSKDAHVSLLRDTHDAASVPRSVYPTLWLVMALAAIGWSGGTPAALVMMLPLLTLSCLGGYHCYHRINRAAQVMRWVMVILGFVIALPLLLRSRLLMGMLIFIFFMLLALGFTLRQRREVYMMLLGSLGLMLYSASYAPDRLFNWLIPFWVLAAVLVMMQLNISSARTDVTTFGHKWSGLAVFPVALAIMSLAWLLLWLLPRPDALNVSLFAADRGLIYDDDSWAAQAQARQAAPQPGDSTPGNATGSQRQGDSGLSQEPRLVEALSEPSPPRLLLQVESVTPVLLRTMVFDHYQAGSWRRSTGADRYHRLAGERFERPELSGEPVLRQTVEVMAEMEGVIPHLPVAQKLEVPSRVLREDRHGNLYLPDRLQPGVRYTVHSVVDRLEGRLLYPGRPPEGTDYRQRPAGHERLCTRAQELGANREPLAAAARIEQYLLEQVKVVQQPASRGLAEALELGQMTSLQRVSAFVLMQRCLGTSSRVVSGYQSSLQHPLTGRYQVTTENGTVWAEVWLERNGWLRFTVHDAEPEPTSDSWLEQARQYVEQRLGHSNLGLGERLGLMAAAMLLDALITLRNLIHTTPWVAALLSAILLAALVGLWRVRHPFALRWLQFRLTVRLKREPERAAIWLFAAVERWFTRLGQPRHRHETAQQYLLRLQQTNPALGSLTPLLRAFQQQRYGQGSAASAINTPQDALELWHELGLLTSLRAKRI